MTVKEALSMAKSKFEQVDIKSGRLDSEILLASVLKKDKEWLIAHDNDELSAKHQLVFNKFVERRLDREPVCYITNKLDFYGIDFYVDNRVLSPRVETELIVEEAIKNAPKNSKLIDLGTGSGAIAVAIAKHRPDLEITATEISEEAMEVAKLNAKNILGKDNKIKFIMADVWDGVDGTFETIVTNLPYVSEDYKPNMKPEVLKEPAVALFGGKGDGLDLYRKFYSDIKKHINPDSKIYHESDPWQHEGLKALAEAEGLKPILEEYLILGFQNKTN
jgi:release factor glutamine methyltransferase